MGDCPRRTRSRRRTRTWSSRFMRNTILTQKQRRSERHTPTISLRGSTPPWSRFDWKRQEGSLADSFDQADEGRCSRSFSTRWTRRRSIQSEHHGTDECKSRTDQASSMKFNTSSAQGAAHRPAARWQRGRRTAIVDPSRVLGSAVRIIAWHEVHWWISQQSGTPACG